MIAEPGGFGAPVSLLAIGEVIEVSGTRIVVELDADISELSRVYHGEVYDIGQFGSIIKVHYGQRGIFAMVRRLRMKSEYEAEQGLSPGGAIDQRVLEADLIGEGRYRRNSADSGEATFEFERGVATYPLPKQTVYLTPKAELRSIYSRRLEAGIRIGDHIGSGGVECHADMNELIGKHTAILGTTGSGKSAAVSAIVHSIGEQGAMAPGESWNPRIVILDPHNEYAKAFPQSSPRSTDDGSLRLPYWLLNLQETYDLVLGRSERAASAQARVVKQALVDARRSHAHFVGLTAGEVTADSPIPYSLEAFRDEVLKDKKNGPPVLEKLDALEGDGRLGFLMANWTEEQGDLLPDIMTQLLSVREAEGGWAGPEIIDLSGVPFEVAGIASAVLARSLFTWKVWQTPEERRIDPVLLVCEEAHLYVPDAGEAQYGSAQQAIRRIAREGRKYGIGLFLVSQRPSEIDSTVLSQCNSWIVLRIGNDADKSHVGAVLPDAMQGMTEMLSSLRRQEAIFVGQASQLPSRIRIRDLEPHQLPESGDVDFYEAWQEPTSTPEEMQLIADRWRRQQFRASSR